MKQISQKSFRAYRLVAGIVTLLMLAGRVPIISAQGEVTSTGTYKTSIAIPVPPGSGAPNVSLEYNSAAGLGIAGVGWDLSVGWPTLIARDTRFGTPTWDSTSAWVWGNTPLVSTTPNSNPVKRPCSYRTAPDALAKVMIDLQPASSLATVTLPNGVVLTYEPVRYDGVKYPAAPAGAQTNVFAFLLKSVKTPNGYLTCFKYKHWGDTSFGRVAVMDSILYGPALKDCDKAPSLNQLHCIAFEYVNPIDSSYFAPMSFRFGAPVSFNNLLNKVTVFAADMSGSAPIPQTSYEIIYQPASATETRLPRLEKVILGTTPGGQLANAKKRTLRRFAYGNRSDQFGAPELIDLGEVSEFPPSLSGSVSRPMRNPYFFNNPNGVFRMGHDQADNAAPPTFATTEQWGLMDLNGDGLADPYWARESGQGATWPTFESTQNPAGPRPAQQQVRISEGINNGRLVTTPLNIETRASTFQADFSPDSSADSGFTKWIWAEGRGMTRTGMPTSISAPEIRNIAAVCPPGLGQDSRLWPVLPDGTLGGSQASIAQQVESANVYSLIYPKTVTDVVAGIREGYQPSHSVSATLSAWLDLTGDGLPDFVATPGLIERFTRDDTLCLGFARKPTPAVRPNGEVDSDWHLASIPNKGAASRLALELMTTRGPKGPIGLPLDYNLSTGSPEGFGFTVPISSLVTASTGGVEGLVSAAPELIIEAFSPRTTPGFGIHAPSPSAMGFLYGLANVAAGQTSIEGFVSSLFKVTFDLTILSAKSRNRSENRAQVMDINADGWLDYLLYDSGTKLGGAPGGALVAFLNGPSGFSEPKILNSGFDYTMSRPDLIKLAQEASNADLHASVVSGGIVTACQTIPIIPSDPVTAAATIAAKTAACGTIFLQMMQMASTARAAAKLAEDFLNSTTDAIPAERFHVNEAYALADALDAAAIAQFAAISAAPWTAPIAADLDKDLILAAANVIHWLERNCRQLDYRSRINVLSRGFSELDGSLITDPATGISVQTRGLVDLNGDALPDYVITEDRETSCGPNQWKVFWGIGPNSNGRAFTAIPTCVIVPPPPDDVAARGFTTLPMNVSMVHRKPTALAQIVDTIVHSYVTLNDFNHDGRPDLILAGEGSNSWNVNDTSRTWTVYLNNGRGFDVARKLQVSSPSANMPGVSPASSFTTGLAVPYPSITTTHTDGANPIAIARDRNDTHASIMDIDGDGVSEVVRRVTSISAQTGTTRAGLLVWSRASNAPQDLMTEERDPIVGSRTLVSYLPAARFQWKDGVPDGNPPPGGHRPAVGSAAYLVRSVTSEPFMGRATRRTAIGYDYKDPYFDPKDRAFTGFARTTKTPLDPATGNMIPSSTSTVSFSPQREHATGGETQVRVVDNSTGAPVGEALNSYIEVQTAAFGPGPAQAYFSGLGQSINLEFPHELTKSAILDLSFDGRSPLANRANRNMPLPTASAGSTIVFDPLLPTGGGMTLNGIQQQWVEFVSPHYEFPDTQASLGQLTIEAWIQPSASPSRGVIARHGDNYELAIESSGEITFGANSGGWTQVRGDTLPPGKWSHIVASYDGGVNSSAGKLRIYVDTKLKGEIQKTGTITASGKLRLGCAWDATSNRNVNYFSGSIGELRIYPEAWKAPARITNTRTKYNSNPNMPNFGMPIEMWKYGDIAVSDDDVYEEVSYAIPQSSCEIQNSVATNTRRVLKADGTVGPYLGYSAVYYDDLPLLGQVGTSNPQVGSGNPTKNVVYSDTTEFVSLLKDTTQYTTTKIRYKMPGRPGIPTETVDPMDAVTKMTWDSTCAFQLTTTNALGHTVTNEYFGVNGVSYSDPSTNFGGLYGQTKSVTDANGGQTLSNYDEWGRTIASVGPYDSPKRPAVKNVYRDARCRDASGNPIPCDDWKAVELASVTQVTDSTWDDVQHSYRVTHTFGDGQVQTEVVNDTTGKNDWLISGAQDYDVLGRVITTYKPRYMPTDTTATSDRCPAPGIWCDSDSLKKRRGDPLRDPKVVAHVQTAYDSKGRVIRTYAPNVPAVPDPSARDAWGNLLCDLAADTAKPKGHYTQFEYPAPRVVRTIDARGVPSVTRSDALDRLEWVEEYEKTNSAPYSTVHYKYDRNGNVTEVKDINGNTTTAVYDALGRKTSSKDPDMGAWTYVYNKRGQLIEQYDAANALTKNEYDLLGRLIRTEYWTPPAEGPGLCEEEEKVKIPKLDIGRWIPLWKPDLPVVMKELWRHVPQFTNQKSFTLLPERAAWEDVELIELPLQQGDLDNGIATLPLPFDFALQSMRATNVEGEGLVPATEIIESAFWPVEHPLLVTTNGKVLFVRSELETAITQELTSDFVAQPRSDETALYPLLHDLELSRNLFYALLGESPNRRLLIQWEGVSRTEAGRRTVFRTILSERSFEVEYQYRLLDFSPSNAYIGMQYLDPATSVYTPIEFRFDDQTPASRRALTSLRKVAENPLQFKNDVTSGTGEPLWSHFAFDADLTGLAEAELSFQHSWNTRCADVPQGSCAVDQMSVLALVDGEIIPLLSNNELTAKQFFNIGLDRISEAPTMRVPLPQNLLNKQVTFVFNFETIDGEMAVEKDGWILDQLNIFGIKWCTVKKDRQLEDVVERRYDSAEPFFTYDHAKPIIDLTFDVPEIVTDRSPLGNTVKSIGAIRSAPGVSGNGVQFNGAAYIAVSGDKLPALKKAVTIEAWVKPAVRRASLQNLIGKKGTFSLNLTAAGNLQWLVFKGSKTFTLTGTTLLPEDAWTHVAVTYDGDSFRSYVNGVPEIALQIKGELDWASDPLYIGYAAGSNYFTGMIDEVRVFSTVRKPAEVLADAQLPHRGGPPRGNVLDLRFVDPKNWGADSSGSRNHADLTRFLATPTPGIQGTAVQFDGTAQQWIVVPHDSSLASDELTAEVWLKTSDIGDRLLVGKWNGVEPGWRLALQENTGQVRFEVRTSVQSRDTWTEWKGSTSGLSSQGNGWCGESAKSPTARKLWTAPATGIFTFNTINGANWNTVVFIRDLDGNSLACNDDATGTIQSWLQLDAVQGETYQIFVSGYKGASGDFTLGVGGPRATNTSFVTVEKVNDGIWHHIAGVYDGKSLRVYIDGKPALRTCRTPEVENEGGGISGGEEIPCTDVPERKCRVEWEEFQEGRYPTAICVVGSIINNLPVFAGNYDPKFFPNHPSLAGMEDEIRISNYPKRDFEMAGSARLYSAYTNALGREVEVRNGTSYEHNSYDLLGREVSIRKRTTLSLPGKPPVIGEYVSRTAYDNLGRAAALHYPDGEVAVSNYDRGGTQISLVGYGDFMGYGNVYGKQPYLMGAAVNSTGKIANLQFGNQARTTFTYDEGPTKNPSTGNANPNGTFGKELLSQQTTTLKSAETLQDQHYEYDPVGNLLRRKDFSKRQPPALHSAPLKATYTYDDLSRLTSFTNSLGATLAGGGSYSYDPIGNLKTKEGATLAYGVSSVANGTTVTIRPHAVTQVTNGGVATQYLYDANGRLRETQTAGAGKTTFAHNIPGKISSIKKATGTFTFTYDGNGERVHKVEQNRVTVEPLGIYRETLSLVASPISKNTEKYYFASGRRLARRVGQGDKDVFWYHPEHLGSTNLMTAADGIELQDAYSEYTPFGTALANKANNTSGTSFNQNTPNVTVDRSGGFQFTDKELDDTGLYYYGARYYDPDVGRFLTPDPIMPNIRPQALNRYTYVYNNPVINIDPTGHAPQESDLKREEGFKLEANATSDIEIRYGNSGCLDCGRTTRIANEWTFWKEIPKYTPSGSDLGDLTYYINVENPLPLVINPWQWQNLGFGAFANIFAQAGATIAELSIFVTGAQFYSNRGEREYILFGNSWMYETFTWYRVQEGFNDYYRWALQEPLPDRTRERKQKAIEQLRFRMNTGQHLEPHEAKIFMEFLNPGTELNFNQDPAIQWLIWQNAFNGIRYEETRK